MSILKEEEEAVGEEIQEEGCPIEEFIPHISLNALEGTVRFNTMKVTRKIEKQTLHKVDSRSTHNFLISSLALRLQCELTTINPITIQVVNEGKMVYKSICKGLKWTV